MTRLRVVIVVPGFVVDRDEPGMAAVVDVVERIGRVHDCRIIALRHPARGTYSIAGVRVTSLGGGRSGGVLGRTAVLSRGVRAVVALHRRRPVDLVHGLWLDEPGAVASTAGRIIGRPSIASVMGGELVALHDIAYGAARGPGGRVTAAIALRAADLVTVGSTLVRTAVGSHRPTAPVELLPLGVDVALFHPSDRGPAAAAVPQTLLFVGSLEPVKDPALMLRLFGRLAEDRPGLRLEIVGEGSLRAGLERDVERLGLGGRVTFAGHIPRAALSASYRAAAVLVVTSRHEGQSMVAVEAAASGLPVVGTRVGILPDLEDGAVSVSVGDETALAGAIASVLDDPERAAAMSLAGRRVAVEQFDLDRTSAALLARYDVLVNDGRASAR